MGPFRQASLQIGSGVSIRAQVAEACAPPDEICILLASVAEAVRNWMLFAPNSLGYGNWVGLAEIGSITCGTSLGYKGQGSWLARRKDSR
jgi:hypothetical protein